MSRYLITGVAGFIGSNLARELLRRGESVRGIDNFSTGKRENLADLKGLDLIEADLNSPGACERACAGVEVIFHEAALPSVPRSVVDPIASNHANVTSTLALLWAARQAKVRRIVYAGSSSAYGSNPALPKREEMLPQPISPYAVSKLTGEYYMQSFTQCYGLETVTLRYFNVFGPFQDPTSQYSGVMARFTLLMLKGGQPVIYGDGEQSRDFTYIENVVNANFQAASAPAERVSGRVFNLATGSRITINQVFHELASLTGFSGKPQYTAERAGDVKHSLADISAARAAFGYQPTVDFAEGLRRTVQWYRESASATAKG